MKKMIRLLIALIMIFLISCQEKKVEKATETPTAEVTPEQTVNEDPPMEITRVPAAGRTPEQPVVESAPPLPENPPSSSSDVRKKEDVPVADTRQKSAHPEAIIDLGTQEEADEAIEEAQKTAEQIRDATTEAASQAAEQLKKQATEGQSLMEQAQQNRPPGLEKLLPNP